MLDEELIIFKMIIFPKNHCLNTLHFQYRKTITIRHYSPRTKNRRNLAPQTIVPRQLPIH